MNNQTLIEKAAMSLSDLASGGKLNVQQSNQFLRMVRDAPTIINSARFVPMESDSRKIEKIGFGQRILKPGVEGTPLSEGDKSVPTTSTIQLNAKEVIAEVNITYDTLENNIEKGNLQNTIMQMIAERAALDIEELIVNGDTASGDAYLALIDGLRKQATSHVVDAQDVTPSKYGPREVFKRMRKAMPYKYLRNPRAFNYYTSYGMETEWADAVGYRETAQGDGALANGTVLNAYGVPVKGIAMLQPYNADPDGDTTFNDYSDAILTHPKNIVVGMPRDIRVEFDKDIRSRQFIIVLTAKLDALYEEEDAVVKAENVREDITTIA